MPPTTAESLVRSRLVAASPVYYGWIVWLVALIAANSSAPGQSFSVSLFMDYFIEDFGLDRTTVSGLYGAGTFVASLGLTWIGRQIDRWGNRRVGTVIATLFAIVLVLCALINGPVMLFFAFVGLRGLGQGGLTLVGSTAVANWFRQRRGRMMALAALTYALFQGIYVNLLRLLLDVYDWRQVFVFLAIALAVLVVPVIALFMRDKPEQFGLEPDAERGGDKGEARANREPEDNWTLAEALRTPMLWILLFARMLASAWLTGLVLHQVSIFAGLGHGMQVVTETYALLSVVAGGSALFGGFLIDRFNPTVVVVLKLVALIGASVFAMTMRESWLLVMYALSFGVVIGIGYVFDGAVWPNLFGREFQGEIRGFVFAALVIGSAIGPALFGFSYDHAGGYAPVLWLGAGLSAVVLVMSLMVRPPVRRDFTTV
ncbi:MAG: MFS transporter [Chloroflexi bacterium]|nr:MFS transporter [Chloroflexota bacterium]